MNRQKQIGFNNKRDKFQFKFKTTTTMKVLKFQSLVSLFDKIIFPPISSELLSSMKGQLKGLKKGDTGDIDNVLLDSFSEQFDEYVNMMCDMVKGKCNKLSEKLLCQDERIYKKIEELQGIISQLIEDTYERVKSVFNSSNDKEIIEGIYKDFMKMKKRHTDQKQKTNECFSTRIQRVLGLFNDVIVLYEQLNGFHEGGKITIGLIKDLGKNILIVEANINEFSKEIQYVFQQFKAYASHFLEMLQQYGSEYEILFQNEEMGEIIRQMNLSVRDVIQAIYDEIYRLKEYIDIQPYFEALRNIEVKYQTMKTMVPLGYGFRKRRGNVKKKSIKKSIKKTGRSIKKKSIKKKSIKKTRRSLNKKSIKETRRSIKKSIKKNIKTTGRSIKKSVKKTQRSIRKK